MSKRKFSELQASSGLPDRAVQVQREQLDVAIESGSKSLFRACKVARGFERQKLGRRQKAAREKHEDAETSRLTAEIAALKVRFAPTSMAGKPLTIQVGTEFSCYSRASLTQDSLQIKTHCLPS